MGAHPRGPSALEGGDTLADLIARDPAAALGPDVAARFGELPFLFKVLAADRPLSLQAHPSEEQARAGFAAEEAAGIPRDAPNRSFRDDNHKPELIVALEPFEALCGFKPEAQAQDLLQRLGLADLAARQRSDGTRDLVQHLLRERDGDLAARAVERAGGFADEPACAWAVRLAAAYPGDPGVVVALLLNHVVLAPGEGLFLGAGNLHAYLRGVGLELMANSDNVLRGGLTPKHVDVDALLDVVDFRSRGVDPLRPAGDGPERTYDTPAPEFRLSRIDGPAMLTATGPEILLCTEGTVRAADLELRRGASAFTPPGDYEVTPRSGRRHLPRPGPGLAPAEAGDRPQDTADDDTPADAHRDAEADRAGGGHAPGLGDLLGVPGVVLDVGLAEQELRCADPDPTEGAGQQRGQEGPQLPAEHDEAPHDVGRQPDRELDPSRQTDERGQQPEQQAVETKQ